MDSHFEKLLRTPLQLSDADKHSLFLDAMNDSFAFHFENCNAYQRFCRRKGLCETSKFDSVEAIPFLPVNAFKQSSDLLVSVPKETITTHLNSSATSGVPSSVNIDKETSKRQIKALVSVVSHFLGSKKRPFLVVDYSHEKLEKQLQGRAAAARGFLTFASQIHYCLETPTDGANLNFSALRKTLAEYQAKGIPVAVFGFTYVLYKDFVQKLKEGPIALPEGSFVIHIGGWKKLESEKVTREVLLEGIEKSLGVPAERVLDFYGFTEQIGVVYPERTDGLREIPSFAEVVVRDPNTLSAVADGKTGLLQFLTPLPLSYPGISVLTDDLGFKVKHVDETGKSRTYFKVVGRAKNAEIRGCGEIMAETVFRARTASQAKVSDNTLRLLFGEAGSTVNRIEEGRAVVERLPQLNSLRQEVQRLAKARERLLRLSVDERVSLLGRAAMKWLSDERLFAIRNQGLVFLSQWCSSASLRQTLDTSLNGRRAYLDSPLPDSTGKRLLTAVPKGLACHWLAGNVPILGLLSIVQSVLVGNGNLVRASSRSLSVLPILLDVIRQTEFETPSGEILSGQVITDCISVVYFDKGFEAANSEMSELADIRVAWGGREAVESVMSLPRRSDCADIVFGPKLSFMVIGRECLQTEEMARKLARRASVDGSVFDQYACASPHNIFVESGGAISPFRFCELLAAEMQRTGARMPKAPTDPQTAMQIAGARIRQEFIGEVWGSPGTEWTILFHPNLSLSEPTYSRVLHVKAADDIFDTLAFVRNGIQTIGLGLEGERRLRYAREAALRGADRLPDIGKMTLFDTPWDGMIPISRMIRWVSLGGPY